MRYWRHWRCGGLAGLAGALAMAVVFSGCGDGAGETVTAAGIEHRTATATATATSTPTPTPTPTATPTPTPTPTPEPAASSGGASAGSSGAFTRRDPSVGVSAMRIPRLGVNSGIEYLGLLSNGSLDAPHNPYNTGWYSIYAPPGEAGNAVFSAHVDYFPNIRGPFNQLASLGGGDIVTVVMSNGAEYRYEVIRNNRYTVYDIPMGYVIWPGDRPQSEQWITMITCGGRFQATSASGAGEYLDRDVVVARRVQ